MIKELDNIRLIIFIIISLLVIAILGVLMIPMSRFVSGGMAAIISTTLFVVYLICIDYIDNKIGKDYKETKEI